MGQTITQKILARASGREEVETDEIIEAKIDTLMMHDVTSSDAIRILRNEFKNRISPELNIVVTPDHYVPNKNIKAAELYRELMDFAGSHELENVYPVGENYGVCHVMLPQEGHVRPGDVIVGGDSHTCTYGALGAFSTGIGSTDVGNVLATGRLWFKVPETLRINVYGEMPEDVMAKDLFLYVVGDIGVDGALYQAMEWDGETIKNMSMDERLTLTNMAIEAGAKSGIIEPGERTKSYIREKIAEDKLNKYMADKIGARTNDYLLEGGFDVLGDDIEDQLDYFCELLWSDPDVEYSDRKEIDASGLVPLVARPHSPGNVVPAEECGDVEVDQAYIGSCTGGKYEDFRAAAEILKGENAASGVRLMIVPATQKIYRRLMDGGLMDVFLDAGGVVSPPTCGACLGGHMGVLGPGEVAVSSTNRNFRGRMGYTHDSEHGRYGEDSLVYLASPRTVAASAIEGRVRGEEL